MKKTIVQLFALLLICLFVTAFSCKKNNSSGEGNNGGGGGVVPPKASDVSFYLTTGNQSSLLQKQNSVLAFGSTSNINPDIVVDTTQTFQSVDGFGYTLTDASAELISGLPSCCCRDDCGNG